VGADYDQPPRPCQLPTGWFLRDFHAMKR